MFCKKCGKQIPDGNKFCEFCGTAVTVPSPAKNVKASPVTAATAEAVSAPSATGERVERAKKAALYMSLAWAAVALVAMIFAGKLKYMTVIFYCIPAVVLGISVYLSEQKSDDDRKSALIYSGLALLMLILNNFISRRITSLLQGGTFFGAVDGAGKAMLSSVKNELFPVLGCMITAFYLYDKRRGKKGKEWYKFCSLRCSLAFLAVDIVLLLISNLPSIFKGYFRLADLGYILRYSMPASVGIAFLIFFGCMAVYELCSSELKDVKLKGLGMVWAVLALISSIAVGMNLITAIVGKGTGLIVSADTILCAAAGITGYLLLLRGRRKGLYFIIIGVITYVAAQFLNAFRYTETSSLLSQLVTWAAAALNPFFAYLAVKSADKAAPAAATASPVYAGVQAAPAAASAAPVKTVKSVKSEAPAAAATGEKLYYERDNMGTRQETMAQAMSYWMGERMGLSVKPPFTMYTLSSKSAAEEALLELPFIHRASDSGKLICDRLMTFGCYETTLNGAYTGEWEALVTGNDLTLEEYKLAEKAFESHGGKLRNHDEPKATVKAAAAKGNASAVKYSETVKGGDGISTYEVYTGPDKASAMEFLRGKPVTRRLYYVVVDTPEGSFGRDINGFYQE